MGQPETEDPFAPVVSPVGTSDSPLTPFTVEPKITGDTFQRVDARGIVSVYKIESGVEVKIKVLGPIRQQVKLALFNAALSPAVEKTPEQLSGMSHIELAAYHLAKASSDGDIDAFEKLLDRLIGKPKQSTESVRVNFNVDEALKAEDSPKQIIHSMNEFDESESPEL